MSRLALHYRSTARRDAIPERFDISTGRSAWVSFQSNLFCLRCSPVHSFHPFPPIPSRFVRKQVSAQSIVLRPIKSLSQLEISTRESLPGPKARTNSQKKQRFLFRSPKATTTTTRCDQAHSSRSWLPVSRSPSPKTTPSPPPSAACATSTPRRTPRTPTSGTRATRT